MNRVSLFVAALVWTITLGSASRAQSGMISEIAGAVPTDFGTYRPYPAVFEPQVPDFAVEPDFSNVVNFPHFTEFNDDDLSLLRQNHFVVKYGQFKEINDVYTACTWEDTPAFVTTDAVLHIYHVLYDRLLAHIEVEEFVDVLGTLTRTLKEETERALAESSSPLAEEAARANLAYLCVADRLLGGDAADVPPEVRDLVDAELELLTAAGGFHYSPIFGQFSKLDYSQAKPRGHYTRSETLDTYFRAMMWYGWTIFTMEPDLFGDLAARHTLQALMLVQMLYNSEADGRPLLELWQTIYEPTVFFVGKTDDPNVRDYKAIADEVYGAGFPALSPDELAQTPLLEAFMAQAQELPQPKIPNWVYGEVIPYKGFRFMGQRFIPDSYMFAHLVFPEVGDRAFPKGLDLMAILGSERAWWLLDSVYGETAYAGYSERIAEFSQEFADKPPAEWAQNLYWNWLYCLMPLLYDKGAGYPFFMQTEAWSDKELLTALASWAQLRHDTILYAKQSTTPKGTAQKPLKGYVEPNPHLYARLAGLARYTREGLDARGLLPDLYRERLSLFETLLLFLRDVSVNELENRPLSDWDADRILGFAGAMEDLVSKPLDAENPWDRDSDDLAVVADVHTDSNSGQCLEEGVGHPLEIFVIVNEGGVARLTRGAIFSYYEFTQPLADRLTDEAWQEMLTGGSCPDMPQWVASFMDAADPPTDVADYPLLPARGHGFTSVDAAQTVALPEALGLSSNWPNPFNPTTTIRFTLPQYAPGVKLAVYNLCGQLVRVLWDGALAAGVHTASWEGRDQRGRDVASGVYLCCLTLQGGERILTGKMVLIR